MSKPELGTKRDCPECGARFYDLHKEPAHCPKCHHEFIPEALLKPRKTRAEEEQAPKPEGEVEAPAQETSLEAADEENKPAESKRKSNMDDEDGDDDEIQTEDDIPDIDDIEVDLEDDDDDNNNDTLLDDDEDDDVSNIIKPTDDDT